tara:strand:+ start:610 stop:1362 length:753 start_codon:yes stop_codon:yes gene_type:complete
VLSGIGCAFEPALMPLPDFDSQANGIVVVIHGSGDRADMWPAELLQAFVEAEGDALVWDRWAYDWSTDAENRMQAAEMGLLHGAHIASLLLEQGRYTSVHLIGHSVGGFVVHQATLSLKERDQNMPSVHATYLDPFSGLRFVDWTFGEREFGKHADFAEAYVNVGDSAPSTDGPFLQLHNFDVTAVAKPDNMNHEGHWWPIDAYLQTIGTPESYAWGYALSPMHGSITVEMLSQTYPKGAMTTLEGDAMN